MGERIGENTYDSRKKGKLALLLGILLLVGILAVICYQRFGKSNRAENFYEQLREVAVTTAVAEDDTQEIDFMELWKENPEIYAWIQIPGTSVNYPILQRDEDNSYYLNHTVNGVEGLPGSIYTEGPNTQIFEERNLIIYGHNMKNGTMFGSLKNYAEASYMDEHSEVVITLSDRKLKYQIFASVIVGDEYLPSKYDFIQESDCQRFLDDLATYRDEENYIDSSVEVNTWDKLITLSTCVDGRQENRRLIVAKRVDWYE